MICDYPCALFQYKIFYTIYLCLFVCLIFNIFYVCFLTFFVLCILGSGEKNHDNVQILKLILNIKTIKKYKYT